MEHEPTKSRHPLGLPSGSIRALLTLLIVAVVIVQTVRNQEVKPLWLETLLIALAHYFTSRRFIHLPQTTVRQLQQDGLLEEESAPLYLPRHSIRAIIVVAFLGMTIYLYREGTLFDPARQALSIMGVVGAYMLGIVARGFLSWWTRGRQTDASRSWEDAKARRRSRFDDVHRGGGFSQPRRFGSKCRAERITRAGSLLLWLAIRCRNLF